MNELKKLIAKLDANKGGGVTFTRAEAKALLFFLKDYMSTLIRKDNDE